MESSEFAPNTKEITVTLPIDLLNRLNETIPHRQRSQFIAEVVAEYLALIEQSAALEETAGSWSENNHPEMKTEADIDYWLDQLRKGWTREMT